MHTTNSRNGETEGAERRFVFQIKILTRKHDLFGKNPSRFLTGNKNRIILNDHCIILRLLCFLHLSLFHNRLFKYFYGEELLRRWHSQ